MIRKSVVLPHPDGPMKDTNSPSSTDKLTFERAKTGPSAVVKVKDRFCASMTLAGVTGPSGMSKSDEDFGRSDSSPSFLVIHLGLGCTGIDQMVKFSPP